MNEINHKEKSKKLGCENDENFVIMNQDEKNTFEILDEFGENIVLVSRSNDDKTSDTYESEMICYCENIDYLSGLPEDTEEAAERECLGLKEWYLEINKHQPPDSKDKQSYDSLMVSKDYYTIIAREAVNKIKEYLKHVNWHEISDDWKIQVYSGRGYKTITLNPYQDCSESNPLYMHKQWLEWVYTNEKLNLTDQLIAEICGFINNKTIGNWRAKFNIKTKTISHYLKNGYKFLRMPKEYRHPEIKIRIYDFQEWKIFFGIKI